MMFLLAALFLSVSALTEEEIQDRERLDKTHFRIVTIKSPPFIYQSQVIGDERLKGFLIDILEELQTRLNFTYDLYLTPDERYGILDPEGNWHGMIGELVAGKADMALAPLTMTRRRSHAVTFGAPYMEAGIVPLTLKPQKGERIPFQNLLDLVVYKTNLQYGAVRGGSTSHFFVNSKYPLFNAMGEYMRVRAEDVMARDVNEAAARVREGGYVFLGEEPMMEWLAGREPCDLLVVGSPINSRAYSLAFTLGEQKTADIFSWEMMSMKEDGSYQLIYKRYFRRGCSVPKLCMCNGTQPMDYDVSNEDTLPDYN